MRLKLSKILVIFITLFGTTNIYASSDEDILKATSFIKIENKIGKEPIMLEFGATSCKSCIEMSKLLYKIKEKYPKSNIYFIDVHKDQEITRKFKIRMIPTQIYLDEKGNIIDTHMGIIEQDELISKLKKLKVI